MTRSPREFFTQASRTFHSFGTVQSNTGVPLGTSKISSGTCSRMRSSVRRTPSPVMLRTIGYSRRINAWISSPIAAYSATRESRDAPAALESICVDIFIESRPIPIHRLLEPAAQRRRRLPPQRIGGGTHVGAAPVLADRGARRRESHARARSDHDFEQSRKL